MSFQIPGERKTLNAIQGRVAAGYRAAQSLVRRSPLHSCRVLPHDRLRLAIDSGTLRRHLASRSFPIFVGYRGHARRFLSALLKYPQKSLGSLRVGFRRFVLSWFVPAHVEQQTMEADEACSKNQTMRFTA